MIILIVGRGKSSGPGMSSILSGSQEREDGGEQEGRGTVKTNKPAFAKCLLCARHCAFQVPSVEWVKGDRLADILLTVQGNLQKRTMCPQHLLSYDSPGLSLSSCSLNKSFPLLLFSFLLGMN